MKRQRAAIIKVAADLASCYGMPPTDPSDWDFDPATPHADRLKILEWARTSQSQCKFWARKLKDIVDPLPGIREIEEIAGPLEDYQKSIIASLVLCADEDVMKTVMSRIRPLASESQREDAGTADEKPDGQEENAEPSHR
jgi:hypothetical protein